METDDVVEELVGDEQGRVGGTERTILVARSVKVRIASYPWHGGRETQSMLTDC